jgi:hypothetical protein
MSQVRPYHIEPVQLLIGVAEFSPTIVQGSEHWRI